MIDDVTRLLAERCPVGLSLHDERGRFTAANDECARIFGRERAALLGAPLGALIDPRDVDRVLFEWDRAALRGEAATLRYRLADGTSDVETDLRVHDDPAGRRVACATRRRPADAEIPTRAELDQQNLELARRHRDALVHMLPALVWFGPVTPDLASYKLSYINEYLFDLAGYTREEWFETPGFWRDLIHPDDRERTLEMTRQLLRGEIDRGPQYRLRARSGRYLWVQSSLHVERDAAGVPVRMYGITLDVTSIVETRERNDALVHELTDKAQQILELSAPVIPLGADVLILPLLGTLDRTRLQHATETLLHRVRELRTRRVIIDLTGVRGVDVESLDALTRLAAAVRLLGARPMLTGVRPEVALGMLELGDGLVGLRSYPSLSAAVTAP